MTREEAIRRIKAWNLNSDDMEVLSVVIPDLRKSEDERIRKLLVWQVHRNIEDETNDLAGSVYDGIKGHDPDLEESIEDWKKCLAWLEKQKDASKAIEAVERIDKYIDAHTANAHDMNDSNPDKKYYQGQDDALGKIAGILQDVYSDEQQKEQKPAKWSEEDNIGWDEAFACVTRAEKAAKNEEELQNAVIAEKWLKEIKFKYYVYPQPKQEWSDEDERKLNRIYEILGHAADDKGFLVSKRIIGEQEAVELQDFLKYLLPRLSWKPSEEQMKALLSKLPVIKGGGDKIQDILKSLYDDLKKLMEE